MAAISKTPELKEASDPEVLKTAVKREASDSATTELESPPSTPALSDHTELDSSESLTPLGPRKRAKTQNEKEQRRIERIMRNRQAAHASREKKRKYLETLESRCTELTAVNKDLEERARTLQRSQAQTLEQHSALHARVEQLEAAIRIATTSRDLSALDATLSPPGVVAASLGSDASPAPSLVDDCASPDTLFLQSSFTNPSAESPFSGDEPGDDDIYLSLAGLADEPYNTMGTNSFDSSAKAHHPAEMML